MDKIIGIGNALVDILARIGDEKTLKDLRLPVGSMQLIDENRLAEMQQVLAGLSTEKSTGGAASNTVCALACLGASPAFIGKIGDDAIGAFYEESLHNIGVTTHLFRGDCHSGQVSAFVLPDGERTFATYLGAADTLEASDLNKTLFEGYSYLYIEGYLLQDHELILRAMQLAKEAGLQVCLDMASYNVVEAEREFFDMLVCKYVDIVFANEAEAYAYTNKEPNGALLEIASKCSVAVVKLGAGGSIVKKGTESICVEPYPVKEVVDTTGAGDFYAAGFLYALTSGYSLGKCAQVASVLAGYVIQTVGTTLSPKVWDEIKLNVGAILQGDAE